MTPAISGWIRSICQAYGVVIGTGSVHGNPVAILRRIFTVAGGSLGLMHSRKITKIIDHALKMRIPLIGITDSGGARIQERCQLTCRVRRNILQETISSGVIPQISVILGPCAGGAVYSPALTDFVFVVENISKMFITGRKVIKTVLGEEISMGLLAVPGYIARLPATHISSPCLRRSVSARSSADLTSSEETMRLRLHRRRLCP